MATEEKTTQPFGNLINPYTNKPVQTGKGVSLIKRFMMLQIICNRKMTCWIVLILG